MHAYVYLYIFDSFFYACDCDSRAKANKREIGEAKDTHILTIRAGAMWNNVICVFD